MSAAPTDVLTIDLDGYFHRWPADCDWTLLQRLQGRWSCASSTEGWHDDLILAKESSAAYLNRRREGAGRGQGGRQGGRKDGGGRGGKGQAAAVAGQ